MYGYVKEIYEIYIGLGCEKYSKKKLRNFVENTRDNADEIHTKWYRIVTDRIDKAIADNNPTIPLRRYTECCLKYNGKKLTQDSLPQKSKEDKA